MADSPSNQDEQQNDETFNGRGLPPENSSPEIVNVNQGSVDSVRSASVRFNRSEGTVVASNHERMDTAHQSLADALRITYGFLQIGMAVLLILFIFSGFQKINEGERGISVFLGKPSATNIEPGAHLSWPYPMGELIKTNTGAIELPIARGFMPRNPSGGPGEQLLETPLSRFNDKMQLNPAEDGSLITADLNIAHTQWTVNFHRSNHLRFVENVFPESEGRMIAVAVRRGVTQTMAETSIDDLLKKSAETIAAKVRAKAQETLDGFDSGITIDQIVLVRKTPPLYLLGQFASVQSAAQNAGKLREDALLERDQMLNDVAGKASGVLISMIDQYERHVELGEYDQASVLLAQIDMVFAGDEVDYQGQSTLGLVSGEVSELLITANAQSALRVSQAIADLAKFEAKLAQYEANPKLMISRDWSMAMAEFLDKDFVDAIYLPEGIDVELLINRDPDIERAQEQLRKRRDAEAARDERYQAFQRDAYKTRRGIQQEEVE